MDSPTTLPAQQVAGHGSADPSISRVLMIATYALGGASIAIALGIRSSNPTDAAYWAAAGAVGASGILSFLRHAVFHRSDAARMHWDYGRRNDFQIEVGLANLAWGVVGVLCWALAWGRAAAGAVTLVFGIYMLGAAALHLSELRRPEAEGGGRVGPTIASAAFAAALVYLGVTAV